MMTNNLTNLTNTMKTINIENVSSVYSGKDGKCCCGCSGKHTYASAHVKWASKHRGYKVEADEVSDRSVKTIVNKINRLIKTGCIDADVDPKYTAVTDNGRLYIAYNKL